MQKIDTNEEFLERIKELRIFEVNARKEYIWDIEHFMDSSMKDSFLRVKNEEDTHILLLDEIIKILEK